jgi:hypothetical protein
MDLFDVLVCLGLLVLAMALGLAWGWIAVLAYAGTVLIVAGIVGAVNRGRTVRGDRGRT